MTVAATTDYSIDIDMWLDHNGTEVSKIDPNDQNLLHYIEITNGKTKPLTVSVGAEIPQGNRRLKFKGQQPASEWSDVLYRIPGARSDHAYCGVDVVGPSGKERVECSVVRYRSQWKNNVWHSCTRNLPLSMTIEIV